MIVKFRKRAQITLPASVVKALNLRDGDVLECEQDGNAVYLHPAKKDKLLVIQPKKERDGVVGKIKCQKSLIRNYVFFALGNCGYISTMYPS